jgi:hypothetical protein
MNGAMPPLPHMPSWREKELLCFHALKLKQQFFFIVTICAPTKCSNSHITLILLLSPFLCHSVFFLPQGLYLQTGNDMPECFSHFILYATAFSPKYEIYVLIFLNPDLSSLV